MKKEMKYIYSLILALAMMMCSQDSWAEVPIMDHWELTYDADEGILVTDGSNDINVETGKIDGNNVIALIYVLKSDYGVIDFRKPVVDSDGNTYTVIQIAPDCFLGESFNAVYLPDVLYLNRTSFVSFSGFVYLPKLESMIGDSFSGSSSTVVLGENPPQVIGGEIADNDVTFIVPAGSKSNYEADELWKTQKIVEDNQIEITATGDDGNIAEGDMTYSRIVTKGNYATFCLPFETDVPDEFDKVYVPASVALLHDNGKLCVLFKESKNTTIAAKTPFIAKIKNSNFLTLSNSASVASTSVSTNPDEQEIKIFKYKSGSKVLMQDNTYILKWGGTLKSITSSDVPGLMGFNSRGGFGSVSSQLPYRAYIAKTTNSSAAKVADVTAMFLGEDEETVTGIMNLTTEEVTEIHPQGVYTLDGKRLPSEDNLPKGIYIINGKKVVK